MKSACKLLVSLALLPMSAWAQVQTQTQTPGPEIEVVDGKVSMSALGVPLSRIVSMLDRAVGLQSKIAPEVASRNISVRFKDLPLKDAVQKIFEGQPLNYMLIEGKGIHVTGVSQGGTTTGATGSPFTDSAPISQAPLPNVQPIQPALQPANPVPINPVGQPAIVNSPLTGAGVGTNPNPNPATQGTPAPGGAVQPGQMPPPIGANAPMIPIIAQPAAGLPVTTTPAPQQPAGPGTLGATPGAIKP